MLQVLIAVNAFFICEKILVVLNKFLIMLRTLFICVDFSPLFF